MRTNLSHAHQLHGIRVILFAISIIALCLVRVDTQLFSASSSTGSVLAYATNTSRGDLLTYTNDARAQNGLGGFALNNTLNSSAQSKANDMVARNYWAHNTPEGTQPWWFFEQAGYQYSTAGENLAYGFADSSATVTAWMNSAPHQANILGAFTEVGFGIASGASYQGGENTVVVAHYAKPAAAPAPPPPAPAVVQPAQSTPTSPPAAPTPTPAAPAAPTTPTPPATSTAPQEKKTPTQQSAKPVTTASLSVNVPLWQVLFAGRAPIAISISVLLLVAVAIGYGLTHRSLMRHALLSSENYALHHPIMDMTLLSIITLLVLFTTIGRVG